LLQLLLKNCDFLNVDISHSSVATYLRCDGIFQYTFVANLPLSQQRKNCENQLTFGEVTGKSLVSLVFSVFLTHGVHTKRPSSSFKIIDISYRLDMIID